MKRCLLAVAGFACFFLAGCDMRNTQEKLHTPNPDFATRYMMACPECGAPQKAYRITALKSYYRCSGLPPKFNYHTERLWDHTIADHNPQVEQ